MILLHFINSFIDVLWTIYCFFYVSWCLHHSSIRFVFLSADLRMSLCSSKVQFILLLPQKVLSVPIMQSLPNRTSSPNPNISICMLWKVLHSFLVLYHFHTAFRYTVSFIFPDFPCPTFIHSLMLCVSVLTIYFFIIIHKSNIFQGSSWSQALSRLSDHKDEQNTIYILKKF